MTDLRDPQSIGERLFELRKDSPTSSFSSLASLALPPACDIPMYEPTFTDHAEIRRRELEARAAKGDKFAAALLNGLSLAEEPVD